jgi:hypothetical protein
MGLLRGRPLSYTRSSYTFFYAAFVPLSKDNKQMVKPKEESRARRRKAPTVAATSRTVRPPVADTGPRRAAGSDQKLVPAKNERSGKPVVRDAAAVSTLKKAAPARRPTPVKPAAKPAPAKVQRKGASAVKKVVPPAAASAKKPKPAVVVVAPPAAAAAPIARKPAPRPVPKPTAAMTVKSAAKPEAKPMDAAPDRRPAAKRVARAAAALPAPAPANAPRTAAPWPAVGEQERVGAIKFGPRPVAARGFDEERFLFPRNYETNRVRVVVRDPEWLFAYWDVNPRAFEAIRREMGERAMALSRLTLQVLDANGNAAQVVLLPYGARSWYVRIDPARVRYFIELGITLPSGQFRPLARSNAVTLPRGGPSSMPASRSIGYREAWSATGELMTGAAEGTAASSAAAWDDPGTSIRHTLEEFAGASDRLSTEMRERSVRESGTDESKAGASDLYRR